MTLLTQPLRDEHAEILPRIDQLREVADSVGRLSQDALLKDVASVHEFLSGHLVAHAEAEEEALYPAVGEVCGAVEVTATMSREHQMIGDMIVELGDVRRRAEETGPDDDTERDLRRLLYGLHAVVKAHFAKEEEVLLPLLDERLTPERADQMFDRLHRAARSALDAAATGRR